MGLKEVDQPALIDGDEPRLQRGPTRWIRSGKRRQERAQDVVVVLVALVLAAIVVRDKRSAAQREPSAVGQRAIDGRAFLGCTPFEFLEERRFAVTGVAGDDDELELAAEDGRQEVPVKSRLDVGLLTDDVEPTGAGVAASTL